MEKANNFQLAKVQSLHVKPLLGFLPVLAWLYKSVGYEKKREVQQYWEYHPFTFQMC